jgi:SAM-dependent methyltransferase
MNNNSVMNTNLYYKTSHLYDLDPRKLLKDDIPFFLDYAAEVNGDILELACGTGRITIPLAKAGFNVWGVDLSESMIQSAKDKRGQFPEEITNRIHLVKEDMTTFQINKKFPLILAPIRSLGILLEEKIQDACLKNIQKHLKDDGIFIFTLMKPIENIEENWVCMEEKLDWETIDPGSGKRIRRYLKRKAIDQKNQVIYVDQIFYIYSQDGFEERIVEEASMRYSYDHQVEELLGINGFKIIEKMGYYDKRPINDGTELIYVCKKV